MAGRRRPLRIGPASSCGRVGALTSGDGQNAATPTPPSREFFEGQDSLDLPQEPPYIKDAIGGGQRRSFLLWEQACSLSGTSSSARLPAWGWPAPPRVVAPRPRPLRPRLTYPTA